MLKEALLYSQKEDKEVVCQLCNHRCIIAPAKFGICSVRQNIDGKLYTHAYGKVVAANPDPIEKKPLFHFLPGSQTYSFAAIGCNFKCGFCQNWQISQAGEAARFGVQSFEMTPEQIVNEAKVQGCPSISYTYTEPTIFFEYAYETMQIAKKQGLYNIFVTNGYMTPECLEMAKGYLDAANVDLKSFSDDTYKRVCAGRLAPVLESIQLMRKLNIWVEVTTLIVPGMNDSKEELSEIAGFIAGVDKVIPWHISRFHPDYKMAQEQATTLEKLKQAYNIGKDNGLRYVYMGNITAEEETFCYNCNARLIRRQGFSVLENKICDSRCPECQAVIDGVWR